MSGFPIDPCQLRWPWVTLKGRTRVSQFLTDLRTYARTIWPTAIKLGVFVGGQVRHVPVPRGWTPTRPNFWVTLYLFPHLLM